MSAQLAMFLSSPVGEIQTSDVHACSTLASTCSTVEVADRECTRSCGIGINGNLAGVDERRRVFECDRLAVARRDIPPW